MIKGVLKIVKHLTIESQIAISWHVNFVTCNGMKCSSTLVHGRANGRARICHGRAAAIAMRADLRTSFRQRRCLIGAFALNPTGRERK